MKRPRTWILACLVAVGCSAPTGAPLQIQVPSGVPFATVVDSLQARGLVRHARAFRLYARLRGDDRRIRAGRYELTPGSSWNAILSALVAGRVVTVPMTVPEGFRLAQMAPRIARTSETTEEAVLAVLLAEGAEERYGVPGPGLEGYLFPDTYRFAAGVSVQTVIRAMTRRYRAVWTPERRARLDSLGLSEREAVTLASIVQAEARLPEEMPRIASVYHNRLRRGWRLQADPTVLYALGGYRERLLFAAIDSVASSPYNTYRWPGLPPGPIGAPGEEAIHATLYPASESYLYFVARPDGSHLFSRTLAEHNRAVATARRERAEAERGEGRGRMKDKVDAALLRTALRVLVITDAKLASPRPVVEVVGAALAAGARSVQLRNKGDSARELVELGRQLRTLTREHGALLFVNDRVDVALAIEADGVHVGPHDLPLAAVRAIAPPGFLIGRSADDPNVARRAVAEGADYIGCGTVYPTTTKADAGDVIGLAGLERVVRAVSVPVVAIGGITVERAAEIPPTGAAGVAVVGAVMAADDPAEVVRRLLRHFDQRTYAGKREPPLT